MTNLSNENVNSGSIVFLNHSSLIIDSGETKVLCDPWYTGSAFNNGWRLLHENSHHLDSLTFDYIWISHEHPDHFSIPTLKQLRNKCNFIYQDTRDRRVSSWLSRNHYVHALADQQSGSFGNLSSQIFVCDGYDSAMVFTFPTGHTFLNANDARLELGTLDTIQKYYISIDVIAIQFSYANWAGNPGDAVIPLDQVSEVISRIKLTCQALKPKAVILFASYIYFSHDENFFWNEFFWLPYVVKELESEGIRVIVPMPDEVYHLEDITSDDYVHNNTMAIQFWTEKHEAVQPLDKETNSLTVPELKTLYDDFYESLWAENSKERASKSVIPEDLTLTVQITDLNISVKLGLIDKVFNVVEGMDYDCAVSSNTFAFLMIEKFARGTVSINSRIRFNYINAHKFFVFFFIRYANNIGKYFQEGGLSWSDLKSLRKVAVLQSIFKYHKDAQKNFDHLYARLCPTVPLEIS